jgi:hypothetical protein
MANIIEYRRILQASDLNANGVSPLDGEIVLGLPLVIPAGTNPKIQVSSISISDRIPNIFNGNPYVKWDNTKCRVATNDEAHIINLPLGLYSDVTQIADAINNALYTQTTMVADPAYPIVSIVANPVTDKIIISIDGTAVKLPHVGFTLDISKTTGNTDLGVMLGFSEPNCVMFNVGVKRSWASDIPARVDVQGTECDVQSSLISLRRRNNDLVKSLAIVSFAGKTTASPNVWPTSGIISPIIVYEGPKYISSASFSVKTSSGNTLLFMSGEVRIVVVFMV